MSVVSTKELLLSHDELRAAVILAGREIRRLNFGQKDIPVLPILRPMLRESREVAKRYRGASEIPAARLTMRLKIWTRQPI